MARKRSILVLEEKQRGREISIIASTEALVVSTLFATECSEWCLSLGTFDLVLNTGLETVAEGLRGAILIPCANGH